MSLSMTLVSTPGKFFLHAHSDIGLFARTEQVELTPEGELQMSPEGCETKKMCHYSLCKLCGNISVRHYKGTMVQT